MLSLDYGLLPTSSYSAPIFTPSVQWSNDWGGFSDSYYPITMPIVDSYSFPPTTSFSSLDTILPSGSPLRSYSPPRTSSPFRTGYSSSYFEPAPSLAPPFFGTAYSCNWSGANTFAFDDPFPLLPPSDYSYGGLWSTWPPLQYNHSSNQGLSPTPYPQIMWFDSGGNNNTTAVTSSGSGGASPLRSLSPLHCHTHHTHLHHAPMTSTPPRARFLTPTRAAPPDHQPPPLHFDHFDFLHITDLRSSSPPRTRPPPYAAFDYFFYPQQQVHQQQVQQQHPYCDVLYPHPTTTAATTSHYEPRWEPIEPATPTPVDSQHSNRHPTSAVANRAHRDKMVSPPPTILSPSYQQLEGLSPMGIYMGAPSPLQQRRPQVSPYQTPQKSADVTNNPVTPPMHPAGVAAFLPLSARGPGMEVPGGHALEVDILRAEHLRSPSLQQLDPYCVISIAGGDSHPQTRVVKNNSAPTWNQRLQLLGTSNALHGVNLAVISKGTEGDVLIGQGRLLLQSTAAKVPHWIQLYNLSGAYSGRLLIAWRFTPYSVTTLSSHNDGEDGVPITSPSAYAGSKQRGTPINSQNTTTDDTTDISNLSMTSSVVELVPYGVTVDSFMGLVAPSSFVPPTIVCPSVHSSSSFVASPTSTKSAYGSTKQRDNGGSRASLPITASMANAMNSTNPNDTTTDISNVSIASSSLENIIPPMQSYCMTVDSYLGLVPPTILAP